MRRSATVRNRYSLEPGDTALVGRLTARHGSPAAVGTPGLHHVKCASRNALLYVPSGYCPDYPTPLAVLLHGAGGSARNGLNILEQFANERGILLLAPASRGRTWDVILGGFDADIRSMDMALTHTFEHYAVDQDHVAVGGFSDGASYALSVGVTNGDLFSHIMAFSPGFMSPADECGKPAVFVSHGTNDPTLPVTCSRRIVASLESAEYRVVYHEFTGGHTIPSEIAAAAVDWFLGD